jgi:ABC-2 type transport system ATP-binding protein
MWALKFRAFVQDMRRPGRTILIASHDLAELSALTDTVHIIDHGRIVRSVDTRGRAPSLRHYRITVVAGAEHVTEVFPDARAIGDDGSFEVRTIELLALNAGLAELLKRGVTLASVTPTETLLEHHFREAVEEANP